MVSVRANRTERDERRGVILRRHIIHLRVASRRISDRQSDRIISGAGQINPKRNRARIVIGFEVHPRETRVDARAPVSGIQPGSCFPSKSYSRAGGWVSVGGKHKRIVGAIRDKPGGGAEVETFVESRPAAIAFNSRSRSHALLCEDAKTTNYRKHKSN